MINTFRIGHGFDVHKFAEPKAGSVIFICGVSIPYESALIAHSDGDVALHALCDALLGAAALGDIGHHFPDTDPQYAGSDSRDLLKHVIKAVEQSGYQVGNVDLTIMAQSPKMAPHISAMRQNIAQVLKVDIGQVNVKATTTEKLGFVGRKEGIAAEAVALIVKI